MISDMIKQRRQAVFGFLNRVSPCDIRDTIIVSGAPRSGTTWLAELLRSLSGYKFLNEPLLLSNSKEARDAGFAWRTHISPDESHPQFRAFFERALSGRLPNGPLWHYQSKSRFGRLIEHVTRQKLVVKFCRAGRLLHWLLQQFDVRGTVMIIRHPCAVLASQLEHGGWAPDQLIYDIDSEEALGQIPDNIRNRYRNILDEISTRLGLMTAVWCLDYYVPFVEYARKGHPWVLVPYERLVLDGMSETERILEGVDAKMTDEVRKQLDVASAYASSDLETGNRRKQLSKWQDRLSGDQIDRILEIVTAFGLDFYTKELEPNYKRLSKLQTAARTGSHTAGDEQQTEDES